VKSAMFGALKLVQQGTDSIGTMEDGPRRGSEVGAKEGWTWPLGEMEVAIYLPDNDGNMQEALHPRRKPALHPRRAHVSLYQSVIKTIERLDYNNTSAELLTLHDGTSLPCSV
jgi:hypothetical protein